MSVLTIGLLLSLAASPASAHEEDCTARLAEEIREAKVRTRQELCDCSVQGKTGAEVNACLDDCRKDNAGVKALDACFAGRADRMPDFFLPGSYFAYGQGLGADAKTGQTKTVGEKTFEFNGESWVDRSVKAKTEDDFAKLLIKAAGEPEPESAAQRAAFMPEEDQRRLAAWLQRHPERIPDRILAGSFLARFYESRPPSGRGEVAEFPSGSGRCWVHDAGVYRQASAEASGNARCTGSFQQAPPGNTVADFSRKLRAAIAAFGGTVAATGTATATLTGTHTASATGTGTATRTQTGTASGSGTSTATGTGGGAGTATGTRSGTQTATGSRTGTATGTSVGGPTGATFALGRQLTPAPLPAPGGMCPVGSYLDPGDEGSGTPIVNAIIDVDCAPNRLIHANYPGDWSEAERFSDGSTQRASVPYPPDTGDWPGSKMVGWRCPRGGTLQLLGTSPQPGGAGFACASGLPPCAKRRDAQGTPILQNGAYVKESCVYDSGGERHVSVGGICAQDNCASAHWACCRPCPADACPDPKHPRIPACCAPN